jgi:phosphotransferase system IIA component
VSRLHFANSVEMVEMSDNSNLSPTDGSVDFLNKAQGAISIDEKSMRQIMVYLRIDDHDIFVGYIRKLGIEHED